MDCTNSTNKDDHSWQAYDEPKIYLVGKPVNDSQVVKAIAYCVECGVEEVA